MNRKPVFTVPSKTVLNLDSGFRHKLLCDGPTFSTGSACAYTCSFCYVADSMKKLEAYHHDHGVAADLRHDQIVIRRENAVEILRRQLAAPKARAIADKPLVIYASPLVDIAANMDLVRETIDCCKVILERTAWHIRLLSKSNLLPKIAEALPPERVIYGVSTGTLDDGLAAAIEQDCPLVSKRIASLHWLQDHGFRTFGMLCPSLPQPDYTAFALAMCRGIRANLCEHVWAEVINLRGESFTRTIQALVAQGFLDEAGRQDEIRSDIFAWEANARETFNAHATVYNGLVGPDGRPKLRFLQYVTPSTREWWAEQRPRGAVLLGCALPDPSYPTDPSQR